MKKHLGSIFLVIFFVILLFGMRGCNMAWNNREIVRVGYISNSRATGLIGHVEYTRYSDGSQDVKLYHDLGRRLFGSELYQDLDGDNKIDRIRYNGAEWKLNRLSKILIREDDMTSEISTFTKADERLRQLRQKYPRKPL